MSAVFSLAVLLAIAGAATADASAFGPAIIRLGVPAVVEGPEGPSAILIDVQVGVAKGQGHLWIDSGSKVDEDLRASAQNAAQAAAREAGVDWHTFDYYLEVNGTAGGTSAGAPMALGFLVDLLNLEGNADWRLRGGFTATGTMDADGEIGTVAGVVLKSQAAAAAGFDTFAFPSDSSDEPTWVPENGNVTWQQVDIPDNCQGVGIQCVPVDDLGDLADIALEPIVSGKDSPTLGLSACVGLLAFAVLLRKRIN